MPYNTSSTSPVPLAQVAKHEAGESQDKEETGSDRVELPPLGENIPDAGLQEIRNAAQEKVEDNQLEQAQPHGFDGLPERHEGKQVFVEERQVGGKRRQQDYKPACKRYIHAMSSLPCQPARVLTIAVAQTAISGPGKMPSARTAAPLKLRTTRMSFVDSIFVVSTGSSKYMTLTTRR